PILVEAGIGILGMKPMGDGAIVEKGIATPTECLHYAMNLPTSVVITGCKSMKDLEQALDAARTFTPLDDTKVREWLARTATRAHVLEAGVRVGRAQGPGHVVVTLHRAAPGYAACLGHAQIGLHHVRKHGSTGKPVGNRKGASQRSRERVRRPQARMRERHAR